MEVGYKKIIAGDSSSLNLYFLGDVHEGNCNHAEKEYKQAVKIIQEDPIGYWIGMGDYIEAITRNDIKRFDPQGIDPIYSVSDISNLPYVQAANYYKKTEPIADKCLALLRGNHEEAFEKYNSSSIYKYICDKFPNDPVRLGYKGLLKVGISYRGDQKSGRTRARRTFTIDLNHGNGGGGKREGTPLNNLHDTFRWTFADVCVMGHTHDLIDDERKINDINQANKLIKRKRYYGISGCFLRTYVEGHKNYFENKGASEKPIGMLRLSVRMEGACKGLEMKWHKHILD